LIFNKQASAKRKADRIKPLSKSQGIERHKAKYEYEEVEDDLLNSKWPERPTGWLA